MTKKLYKFILKQMPFLLTKYQCNNFKLSLNLLKQLSSDFELNCKLKNNYTAQILSYQTQKLK